jgi:hypothetical protein
MSDSKSKEDQELEEAKRIMSRLVKMPHKPHVPTKKKAAKKSGPKPR